MDTKYLKALFTVAEEDNNQREAERKLAVAKLDELNGGPKSDHGTAERILLEYLRLRGETVVAEAFERARKRLARDRGPSQRVGCGALALATDSTSLVGKRFVSLMGGWGDMEWEVDSEVFTAPDGTNRPCVWAHAIRRVPSRRGAKRIKRGVPNCRRLFFLPITSRSNTQT